MKRLLPLLSIAAILVFTGETTAQTATCQNLTVQLDGTGNYSFAIGSTAPQVDAQQLIPAGIQTSGGFVYQSFTPTVDGVLHSVSLSFSAIPSSDIDIIIRQGQGFGGSAIGAAQTVTVGATGLVEYELNSMIEVLAGNEYTIDIQPLVSPVSLQKNDGDPYAGGRNSVNASSDFIFSTKILRRPDIDNGSTAMAGLASFGVDISSFNCSNIGANTVTLTVTDNTSSSTTCTSTVTVEDVDLPTAVCKDISVNLDANGDATIVATDIDNGSSDNCSITYSADVTAFNCGDIGTNTVTLTVTDPASNSDQCTSTVTVSDVTDPTASCQNFTLVLDGSGSGTLLVSNINNGSSDNCAIATTSLDQTSFNCGDLGTNTVTLTVTDVNGLVSSCTATVTVADNQTPSITCPSDIVECAADASGMLVSYSAAIGSDNCGFTITQTDGSGLTSGNTFPIGSTTQEWTITDAALNVSSCSFTVSVNATPVADYSFSPACLSESIFFTDESTIDPSTSIISWTWNMDDGSGPITLVDPTHVFAALGSYDVSLLVETPEGCSDVVTQTVDVTPVPVAGFTFVEGCEGNATVFTNTSTIASGTLTYAWDFGDTNTSTDASPSNVYALDGTYTVTLTVTSNNGCKDEISHSVTVDNSPTALFTASTECEGFATEFTNLSTGDGVLSHSWDFGDGNNSFDPSPTHTYASAGNYTVVLSVTNSNGCVNTHTVNVLVNALPTVDFTFSNVCEGSTASFVNASSSGTYTWDLGDGSSSSLTNVNHDYTTFGFYDVTLTVTDANFCINTGTQQIEIYDLPDFTLTPTDVLCFGESTGAINTTPVGSPAFPWTLSLNGATPVSNGNFSNLPAGSYDVTAYDVNGCEFTASTVVSQPNEALGINVISFDDILCNGDNSGAISVTGTGGTGPYSYSLDSGSPQVNGTFSGLVAGVHAVQITDNNLCVFDTVIILSEPAVLVLGSVNAEDLLCNGDNSGLVEVAATGGVTPYMYSIDGGSFANPSTFNGLAAGLHILGVLDANGCTDTVHVTLSEPGILQLSILASADANCFGESSGSIETQAASGTAPYQYSLDGVSFVGGGTFEGLSAGTYTITVRDANGCLDNVTETIFEPSVLTIETNSAPVSCFGDDSGMIEIIATGGTPNYQYSSNGGGLFVQNGGQFTDVVAGTYLAVVLDANGCSASEGVIVSQPTSVFVISANVTNAACLNEASGSVQLIGAGGTPTYTYSNDNTTFGTSTVFEGFAAGAYTLYAKDLNGCVDSVNVTISQPSTAVSINNTILNNPACPNSQTGTVTVQAGGGTPPYMYSSNGGGTYQNGQFLFGVGGGNHLIFVMDDNGCTDSDTVTLVSPPLLDFIIDTVIGVPCENNFSGEIHVTAVGGTPSYNYTLNGGSLQSNGDYVNLTSGNYVVAITDVNSCVHSESFTIVADQLLPEADFSWSVSGTAVLFSNNSDFGDTYLWSFGDDSTSTEESPVHVYAEDGDYNVSLTVSNACGSAVVSYNVSTTALGISDSEQIAFGIYPNPASTLLFLQSSSTMNEKLSLEVISISGQLINSLQISGIDANEAMSVDVSSLSNGMYYLRIVGQDQSSVLRFDIIK
ncbi:MAG: PKD domain-containing protein [Flavobacteriales bacterium]|nr:PKD domain-containing protein [Flavobacteriales bacterium]